METIGTVSRNPFSIDAILTKPLESGCEYRVDVVKSAVSVSGRMVSMSPTPPSHSPASVKDEHGDYNCQSDALGSPGGEERSCRDRDAESPGDTARHSPYSLGPRPPLVLSPVPGHLTTATGTELRTGLVQLDSDHVRSYRSMSMDMNMNMKVAAGGHPPPLYVDTSIGLTTTSIAPMAALNSFSTRSHLRPPGGHPGRQPVDSHRQHPYHHFHHQARYPFAEINSGPSSGSGLSTNSGMTDEEPCAQELRLRPGGDDQADTPGAYLSDPGHLDGHDSGTENEEIVDVETVENLGSPKDLHGSVCSEMDDLPMSPVSCGGHPPQRLDSGDSGRDSDDLDEDTLTGWLELHVTRHTKS